MTVTDIPGGPEPGQLLKDFRPLCVLLLDFKTTRWVNNKEAEIFPEAYLAVSLGAVVF